MLSSSGACVDESLGSSRHFRLVLGLLALACSPRRGQSGGRCSARRRLAARDRFRARRWAKAGARSQCIRDVRRLYVAARARGGRGVSAVDPAPRHRRACSSVRAGERLEPNRTSDAARALAARPSGDAGPAYAAILSRLSAAARVRGGVRRPAATQRAVGVA